MKKDLTPAQIAKVLDLLEVINQIGDAIKARAIELAHSGTDIPGYEASFTNAKRIWTDDEAANTRLAELGLEKRERFKVELLSPAQAEKALRSKKLWPRKKASEDFVDPFGGVLGYTETKPSISKKS